MPGAVPWLSEVFSVCLLPGKGPEYCLPKFLRVKSERDKIILEDFSCHGYAGTASLVLPHTACSDLQPTCLAARMWHLDTFPN